MKLTGLRVSFVHDYLGLGGAETVSRQTGRLFAQLGIFTHYYCLEHRAEQWQLPDAEHCSLALLPDKKKLWSKTNVSYLIEDAKRRGIFALIIPVSSRNKCYPELRASGLKLIYWLHTSPFDEVPSILRVMEERSNRSLLHRIEWLTFKQLWEVKLGATRRRIHKRYRHILEHVDGFITLCPAYSQEIIRTLQLPRELAEKIHAVQNTIELPPADTIQFTKQKKIVYMGRLDPISKRVPRLVKIWARIQESLPDWEVEIYGEGSDRQHLESLISQLQLPRISLRGYCADPTRVYQSASILALTSQLESWGLALAEAQSYGCIPIAFDCSAGVRTVIGETPSCGVLIPAYDQEIYARELYRLCQDDALRRDLQGACLLKSLTYAHEQNLPVWRKILEGL